MGVVSIRLPDETERVLTQHGLKVSEFMKNAAEAEARRLMALDRLAALKQHRAAMKPAKTPSEQVLREARDA